MPVQVTRDRKIYSFARGLEPAVTVDPGETVVFQTNDCYDGQVSLEGEELTTESVQPGYCNPATGPVAVKGALPGDMLVVSIESISIASRGLIFGSDRHGKNVRGWPVDILDGRAKLPGGVLRPVDTVIGVIGVSPVGDPVPNSTPGDHGGNLDTPDVKAGCTVFLPVAEAGGMLAMGDLHALQGDGEAAGQGVEIAGEVTARVQVMKGRIADCPVVRTPAHWAVVASGEDLDAAVEAALLRGRDFLISRLDVKDSVAAVLLSTVCDVRISQVVNPLQTVRVCIPQDLVPVW